MLEEGQGVTRLLSLQELEFFFLLPPRVAYEFQLLLAWCPTEVLPRGRCTARTWPLIYGWFLFFALFALPTLRRSVIYSR